MQSKMFCMEQEIAVVITSLIKNFRMTQRQLAAATGIPLVTLNRRLQGKFPFTTTELKAIANELGTTVTDIVQQAEQADTTTMKEAINV